MPEEDREARAGGQALTTPGGVPNLPQGALTLDTLAAKTQDMSGDAMKSRAVERFPTIFDASTGLSAASDLTPFGILTRIFAEVNSLVANADPADIQGPEDLPELVLEFIEGLPVIGQFIEILQAILGTYEGDDETLLAIQAIFAPIRAIMDALTGLAGGTGGLTDFFPDLLGLLGNPTGLGTGSPTVPGLSSIPLFGPLFSLFGGATNSTEAGNFSTNLLSFLANPSLTDSPGSFTPSTAAEAFITTILNPLSLLQDTSARENSQGVIDGGVQAVFGGGGIGHLVSEFFDAFQNTATSSADGYMNSVANLNTLSIRTNNPIGGALERTTVANFPLTQLGTGATPTNFGVTQSASAIWMERMPESDTKGAFYWRSSGNASITGFYLNFGKMALDGTVSHLFQSGNLVGQLTSGWQWQMYTFASGDEITHLASENILAEFVVVGAGTVSVAGLPMAWQTDDHPAATTVRSGATRNTAGGTPTLSNTGFIFTGDTPWGGLGRSTVPSGYIPPDIQTFPNSGSYTYTIPPSFRVAGTLIDYFALGSGGGGQSGGYFLPGQGGECGNWQFGTLEYGIDIPLGTTAFTGSVAAAANGGLNPFVFDPGANGTSTTIVVPTYGTITATGGTGGGRAGNSQGTDGQAAGSQTITDYIAAGGASAGTNQNGQAPGGGGGCGYPAVGRSSGKGKAWFRARQP